MQVITQNYLQALAGMSCKGKQVSVLWCLTSPLGQGLSVRQSLKQST